PASRWRHCRPRGILADALRDARAMAVTGSLVSVVVLTYNRRDEVLITLERLQANLAGDLSIPIIVVDNGSPDGTAQAIRQRFPAVTVVASHCNLGAAGRNLG